MQIDLSRFREAFFEEALEHQRALEAGLLRLETTPDDRDALNSVFRAAHSIKGSSGLFDLPEITRFTHALENLLDSMSKGTRAVTSAIITVLLTASDVLRELVESSRVGAAGPARLASVLAELQAASNAPLPDAHGSAGRDAELVSMADQGGPTTRVLGITITPASDLLQHGMDPLLLLRELSHLGRVASVRADLSRLPELASLEPERCYLSWTLELETSATVDDVRDVFVFVEDRCRVEIHEPTRAPATLRIDAAAEVAPRPEIAERRVAESTSIRVSIEKVDELVDLVGELVIAQSMVHQVLGSFQPDRIHLLEEAVSGMERNMRELQERVMAVRLVPISTVFGRFPRLVRDLSAATGKSVRLDVSGEETELDKSVVERISDPLTHLVRNCVDHGLEPTDARRAALKSPQGTVRLAAYHEGGNVVVEVSDDGRGFDVERIRRKAVARGEIAESTPLTEAEALELIFRPGFSTAEKVSDISGRGVGMDVVKQNVESLNGSITVTTEAGRGATFRIKLPLTLAILDGLKLAVGGHVYVLPLTSIVESFRPGPGDVVTILGRGEVALVRGEPLPLIRLGRIFGIEHSRADARDGIVVIVEHAARKVGLLVDELLGQAQVVVKNLEANYTRVEGVTGATILGDGRVALILDAQGLTRVAQSQRPRTVPLDVART